MKKRLISVSPLTFVTVIFMFVFGYGLAFTAYVVALLMHELAHALTAERLGYELKHIRIMPYGVSICGYFDGISPSDEMVIAAVGPLVNFVAWILIASLWWMFPVTYVYTSCVAEACLFTGIVNLLPIMPLDGGRILYGILSKKLQPVHARKIVNIIGITSGVSTIVLSVILLYFGYNPTYATMSIFIASSLAFPQKAEYERLYSITGVMKRMQKGLVVREIVVSSSTKILALYKMLRVDCFTRFTVIDERTAKPLFTLDEISLGETLDKVDATSSVIFLAKR